MKCNFLFFLAIFFAFQFQGYSQDCNITTLRVSTGFYGYSVGSYCQVDVTFDQPYTNVTQISSCSGTCTCSGTGTNFYMATSGGSCLGTSLISRDFEFTDLPTTATIHISGVGVHNYWPLLWWADSSGTLVADATDSCISGNNGLFYSNWDTTYVCQLNDPCTVTGVEETSSQSNFITVYPIPASNNIRIETSQKSEIEISNIEGQIIKRLKIKNNKTEIDISDFASGVYIIRAQSDSGITTKKFIKE